MPNRINKFIIIDLYGVMSLGSYQDTCRWLCRRYGFDFTECYQTVYHKYFCQAAAKKISEGQSFALAAKELGIRESGPELRRKHLSFQKLNRPVFKLAKDLQAAGYRILLLSKNTPAQFGYTVKNFALRKYFKIINTYNLGIDKKSPRMINYLLKRYRLSPVEVIMIDDQDFNLAYPKRIGVKTILYKNFRDFRKEIRACLSPAGIAGK